MTPEEACNWYPLEFPQTKEFQDKVKVMENKSPKFCMRFKWLKADDEEEVAVAK
jgi:hypothetical protein